MPVRLKGKITSMTLICGSSTKSKIKRHSAHIAYLTLTIFEVIRLKDQLKRTVKLAHNGQVRSQIKSTVRSRWPLRATVSEEFFFINKMKKNL